MVVNHVFSVLPIEVYIPWILVGLFAASTLVLGTILCVGCCRRRLKAAKQNPGDSSHEMTNAYENLGPPGLRRH